MSRRPNNPEFAAQVQQLDVEELLVWDCEGYKIKTLQKYLQAQNYNRGEKKFTSFSFKNKLFVIRIE